MLLEGDKKVVDQLPQETSPLPSKYNEESTIKDDRNGLSVKLLCFTTKLNTRTPNEKLKSFIICSFFVFLFYVFAGVLQEYLYNYTQFEYTWFSTFIQFLVNAAFSLIDFSMIKKEKNIDTLQKKNGKISVRLLLLYLLLGSLSVMASGLSTRALVYVNFPTKTLFKSSKLIVIMFIGHFFIIKKKYSKLDYTASFFLILGLFLIYTANKQLNLEYNSIGIVLLTLSVISDSIQANLQEYLLKNKKQGINKLIFFNYFSGSFYLFIICILTDQLKVGLRETKLTDFVIIILHSLFTYFGVNFVHAITKLQGVVITHTVCSVRKVFSILISYVLFPKPFHIFHFYGATAVFSGIFLRGVNKYIQVRSKKTKKVLSEV